MFQTAKLVVSDGQSYDDFGYSISTLNDYIVVAAPYKDNNFDLGGSVYVFVKPEQSLS